MKIVLASGNEGKLKEFQAFFQTHFPEQSVELISQGKLHVPEADESGLSFVENAILKARHAATMTQLPALADDSGLEVDALNGIPGIYSARYAGLGAGDAANNAQLLDALREVPEGERTARFQCVIVYMRHGSDPTPQIYHGSWEGRILFEAEGEQGFGYDPLFYVESEQCTSAMLSKERKNQISHRGQALLQMLAHWRA